MDNRRKRKKKRLLLLVGLGPEPNWSGTAAERLLRRQLQASLQQIEDKRMWRDHVHAPPVYRDIFRDPWRGERVF